ncbi:MAG: class I SAM-dependent rRNA methyltransferase, partial [Spirochaetes bacterium]|nr:class I SAM-dependent rRNA methyltransferase [Spirochaetota bacterium]
MKKIYLKKSVEKNIKSGHPWIFSGALLPGEDIENGELCSIFCEKNILGIGYYNKNSDIRVRILTRLDVKIDINFFINRLTILKNEKEKYIPNCNSYRLVFGESDNIPGLIVDIYNLKYIVIQVHTLGIEKLKNMIVEALVKIYNPEMIYEKCDIAIREKENLPKESKEVLYGKLYKEVEIIENGYKFSVNIVEGQKTGFFLDQRVNRNSIVKYCADKNVLNCFSYTGGFSVYAASVAKSVTSVDISKKAIENAALNFQINGFDTKNHGFIAKDVFDYLKEMEFCKYDLIILDPPSFAKNQKQLKNAIKAYITINSKALDKLPD